MAMGSDEEARLLDIGFRLEELERLLVENLEEVQDLTREYRLILEGGSEDD